MATSSSSHVLPVPSSFFASPSSRAKKCSNISSFLSASRHQEQRFLEHRLASATVITSHPFAAVAAVLSVASEQEHHEGNQSTSSSETPKLQQVASSRKTRRRKQAKVLPGAVAPSLGVHGNDKGPSSASHAKKESDSHTTQVGADVRDVTHVEDSLEVRDVANADNSSDDIASGGSGRPNDTFYASTGGDTTHDNITGKDELESSDYGTAKAVLKPRHRRPTKGGKVTTDLNEATLESGGNAAVEEAYTKKKPRRRTKLKGDSLVASMIEEDKSQWRTGMCIVRWLVEAELNLNQRLFVVGEGPFMGCWDPSMALGFSLCKDAGQPFMLEAQCQVPFQSDLQYNYFVQVGEGDNQCIVWRPGSRLHHIIPCPEEVEHGGITIQDSLDFGVEKKLPALSWRGLQSEIGFPNKLKRFLGEDFTEDEPSKELTVSYERNNDDHSLKSLKLKEAKVIAADQNVVEPVLNALPFKSCYKEDSKGMEKISSKLRKLIRKKVLPREEPWLLESMILYERAEQLKKQTLHSGESDTLLEDDDACAVDGVEDASSDRREDTLDVRKEPLVEILINSSRSTMERIAILEDGRLVELLLKPINSDINVGNVYLGVVKKLLPGMTAVFVDIGHPRVALLPITKNIYPFTFPPIRNLKATTEGYGNELDEHTFIEQQEDPLVDESYHEYKEDHWDGEVEKDEIDISEAVNDHDDEKCSFDGLNDKQDRMHQCLSTNGSATRPITVNFGQRLTKWRKVEEGMMIIVQIKREPMGKKGASLSAFPQLASRFWILGVAGRSVGVSKKIQGVEHRRLKKLATSLRKKGYGLTVRTEAAGQSQVDLEKDLARLRGTWKDIMEQAEACSLAVENGEDGAVPALLHRAMGQSLSLVRDFFADKVHRMVVDSAQTYHEVTTYLQEVAPKLLSRVELYTGILPIFDVFNLEAEINKLLNERVYLPKGAYLVIEETEALVSIDVNGGAGMLGKNTKSAAILETNLAAARQIAIELRLRDIGGIIVIDFIDMDSSEHETLVYEELKKAIEHDRSVVFLTQISELGLMEVTRKRVRPSVTTMISDPCSCCHGTGRIEGLESILSKIERAILRLRAIHSENDNFYSKKWLRIVLRVDPVMFEFLTRNNWSARLSTSLKVHIVVKVAREMARGHFELNLLKGSIEQTLQASDYAQQRSLSNRSRHQNVLSKGTIGLRT